MSDPSAEYRLSAEVHDVSAPRVVGQAQDRAAPRPRSGRHRWRPVDSMTGHHAWRPVPSLYSLNNKFITLIALLPLSNAYVLSDRGTWASFKNRGELDILGEGDKRLFNQYDVILVNPTKHPQVKTDLGQAFINWLISREGKNAILGYKIEGHQLFLPNGYLSRADACSDARSCHEFQGASLPK
jgi:hypothetical protein